MQVAQCKNGHFFDLEKYQVCPHCGASVDADFKKNSKKATTSSISKGKSTVSSVNNSFDEGKTEMLPEAIQTVDDDNEATAFATEYTEYVSTEKTSGNNQNDWEEKNEQQSAYNTPQFKSFENTSKQNSPQQSLSYPTDQPREDNSGKTIGFFSSAAKAPREPVVGWLVCVKGDHFGECFEIYSGKNSLGREINNKIVIPKDYTVSGSKHLWIIYEPKKREFYVQPGEASGLAYLNGENILMAQKMSAYDKLEIGSGVYILAPLCCDRFSWEDYIE